MENNELLEEVIELLGKKLIKKCNKFYKINGKLEKYKGRINGRKILSSFAEDADIGHEVDTSIWDDEKDSIDFYNEKLNYLKEDIKKLINKIKLIKNSIKEIK